MANMEDDDKEKGGIGIVPAVTGTAAGAALGLGATKLSVDRNIKTNLVDTYLTETKMQADPINAAEYFPQGASAEEISRTAQDLSNEIRHNAHHTVMHSDNPMHVDLRTPGTVLGDAREASRAATEAAMAAQARPKFQELSRKVAAVASATSVAHETAAKDLLKTIVDQAEKTDRANVALKVREISWLRRINPFAEGLHLTGAQKGWAIAAGTTTLIVGGIITGKAFQWMFSGKDQDSTPNR